MGSLKAAFFRKEVLKIKEVNLIVYGKVGVAGKKIKVEEFKEFKNTFSIYDFFMTKWKRKKQKN